MYRINNIIRLMVHTIKKTKKKEKKKEIEDSWDVQAQSVTFNTNTK